MSERTMCVCGHSHREHAFLGDGMLTACRHTDEDGYQCPCPGYRQSTPEIPLESVDHPSHYGGADDPFEHVKVVEALGWGYHIGNCTKYLWRVGKKDPAKTIEDLEKAAWYLTRYIELMKRGQT